MIVDGQILGHPTYNNFRSDVASLFPGYANSGGAVGFYHLNTTTLSNGALHAISWWVVDNAGHYDPMGIGSRYFLVNNPHSHDNSAALQTFLNCVGPNGIGSTCTLRADTYTLAQSQSIAILRSGITVQGGSTDPWQTILIRGPDLTAPMIELGSQNDVLNTVPLTGIKIQYLTFCSGGTKYHALNLGDPNNHCPPTDATMCEMNSLPCLDLSIKNTGPGQAWASNPGGPFTNTGPYNVEVSHSNFEDSSSGHPILITPSTISPGVRQMVDVYFHDNIITDGGVQIGASNGGNWDDYTQCDNWYSVNHTNFADDNTATGPGTPHNIRFGDPGTCQPGTQCSGMNTFYSTAGAISGQGRYIGIYNNKFVATLGGVGGAIEQEECSDQVNIVGNTLTGGSPAGFLLPFTQQPDVPSAQIFLPILPRPNYIVH